MKSKLGIMLASMAALFSLSSPEELTTRREPRNFKTARKNQRKRANKGGPAGVSLAKHIRKAREGKFVRMN